MPSRTSERSPGVLARVLGVVVWVGVACIVAASLRLTVFRALGATGLLGDPGDAGRATALESWLMQYWWVVSVVELTIGALVGWRVCRPLLARHAGVSR